MWAFRHHAKVVAGLPDVLACIVQNTLEHKRMVEEFSKHAYHPRPGK